VCSIISINTTLKFAYNQTDHNTRCTVTAEEVWIGNQIYCTLLHATCDYNLQISVIAVAR
jgi:hypothetical protein